MISIIDDFKAINDRMREVGNTTASAAAQLQRDKNYGLSRCATCGDHGWIIAIQPGVEWLVCPACKNPHRLCFEDHPLNTQAAARCRIAEKRMRGNP